MRPTTTLGLHCAGSLHQEWQAQAAVKRSGPTVKGIGGECLPQADMEVESRGQKDRR